jgi:Lrp/AsnC family leucine-responsive transcriptional regulator
MLQLDFVDEHILNALQEDAGRSNQALAALVGVSPATCLRRVKRLFEAGLIQRQIALLDSEQLAAIQGHGLTALLEITLDVQSLERLQAFEQRVLQEACVQQCYRVSPGPDFVLVVHLADMPAYQALAQRLLTADANVRNVKTFFSLHRAKFAPQVPVRLARLPAA